MIHWTASVVYKSENTAVGIRHTDHVEPYIRKFGTTFAGKWLSIGRYSSLAGSGHGVYFILFLVRSIVMHVQKLPLANCLSA
jgi:hypothetical protein